MSIRCDYLWNQIKKWFKIFILDEDENISITTTDDFTDKYLEIYKVNHISHIGQRHIQLIIILLSQIINLLWHNSKHKYWFL